MRHFYHVPQFSRNCAKSGFCAIAQNLGFCAIAQKLIFAQLRKNLVLRNCAKIKFCAIAQKSFFAQLRKKPFFAHLRKTQTCAGADNRVPRGEWYGAPPPVLDAGPIGKPRHLATASTPAMSIVLVCTATARSVRSPVTLVYSMGVGPECIFSLPMVCSLNVSCRCSVPF